MRAGSEDKIGTKKMINIIVILIFVLNAGFIVRNTTEHIAANKIDADEGRQIKYMIDKYEEETGNKVTKFAYKYDMNPQQYATGIKHMESLTERKLACVWCIEYAMQYYCERDLEWAHFSSYIFREDNNDRMYRNIENKDYNCFSQDQIIIKDDTIYMIVY